MTTEARVLAWISTVGIVITMLLGAWNAYQFSNLAGRVDAIERTQNAHVNAAGLHGR